MPPRRPSRRRTGPRHERRPERGEVRQQLGRRQHRLVPQLHPSPDGRHLHHPPEDVGERQDQQGGGLLPGPRLENGLPPGHHRAGLVHEIAVREHAALGAPGGPRGVDDGGDGVGCDRGAMPVHQVLRDPAAVRDERVDGPGVELPQPPKVRQPLDDGPDGHGLVLVLDDAGGAVGVLEDPVHLLDGGGRVDGHGLRADRPQGDVEQGRRRARRRAPRQRLVGR